MMSLKTPKWVSKRKTEPKHLFFTNYNNNRLPEVLDLSNYDTVDLTHVDLSDIREIKWPKKSVRFDNVINFPNILDFSKLENVSVTDTTLSGVSEIKCPSKRIELRRVTCSDISELFLSGGKRVDLSMVRLVGIKKCKSNAELINMDNIFTMPKVFDFGCAKTVVFKGFRFHQKELDYYCARDNKVVFVAPGQNMTEDHEKGYDKESTKIILPSEKVIYADCAFRCFPELDFSDMKELYFNDADFYDVKNIKWPSEKVVLKQTTHRSGVTAPDFSETKKVIFDNVYYIPLGNTKWPTEYVNIKNTLMMYSGLDISNTKSASLASLSLSSLASFKAPKEELYMKDVHHLPTELDFSGLKKIYLSDVHLKSPGMPEIIWPAGKSDVYVDKYSDYLLYRSYVEYNNELLKKKKEYQSNKMLFAKFGKQR